MPEISVTRERDFKSVSNDPAAVRAAFGQFPSGVAALCAHVNGSPVGLVASSFSVGISFSPPLVMFSAQNSSRTWPVLRSCSRIGISVLGEQHAAACVQLASKDQDRFAGLSYLIMDDGALFIRGSALWLDCRILSEIPAGDHCIVLLEVQHYKIEHGTEPLIYHAASFRQLGTPA